MTRFTLQNDTTATVNDPTEESSDNSSPAFSFLAGSATEFELLAQAGRFAQIPNRVQPVAPTNSIDWRQLGTTHSWNVIPRISSLSTSSILRFSLGVIICHNPSSWGLLVDNGNWCHLVHLLQTLLMDVFVVTCCYA